MIQERDHQDESMQVHHQHRNQVQMLSQNQLKEI